MCKDHHHHHGWERKTFSGERPLRIGIGGPVGSGKTVLVEKLSWKLKNTHELAVITNDIYTREDAEIISKTGVLERDRIIGVETREAVLTPRFERTLR